MVERMIVFSTFEACARQIPVILAVTFGNRGERTVFASHSERLRNYVIMQSAGSR